MKTMSNDDFADAVLRLRRPAGPFQPAATYIPEGDCIEFLAAPDDYYAERVDGLVTVYYSRESGEIIGSLIKGVRGFCERILRRCPGFKIAIEDGRIKLEHIFLAQLWAQQRDPKGVAVRTYRKLIQVAEESGVEAELSVT